MIVSHERSYDALRLHIEMLISAVLSEIKMPEGDQKLRHLSIAGNAILDGLWMQGGALPDSFECGELHAFSTSAFSLTRN